MDQPLWLLNKVPTKNMKTFHLDLSVTCIYDGRITAGPGAPKAIGHSMPA